MRILLFGPTDVISSPEQSTGGIVSHTRFCAAQLQKNNSLYIISFDYVPKITVIKKKRSIIIVLPKLTSFNAFYKFVYYKALLKKIINRINFDKAIVQGISYYLLVFPKGFSTETYIFVHGIMFREYSPIKNSEIKKIKSWIKWSIVSVLEHLSYKRFNNFILINNEMKKFFKGSNTFLLRNQIFKKIENINEKKEKILVCIGNIIPRKRQKLLYLQFKKANPTGWKLIFVGRMHGVYGVKFSALIDQDPNVSLLSNVSDKELEKLLGRAQVFCLPSASESSPISILEAMEYGCKIIASNVGGVPEMREQTHSKNDFHLFESVKDLEKILCKVTSEDLRQVKHELRFPDFREELMNILKLSREEMY